MYDTVVIGAGPAGLLAAREIADRGHNVIVLEEHPVVGEPDHCAGLLSHSGLQSLDLRPPDDVILNEIKGARIVSPSGHSIYIERGKREACVVDRRLFDRWLADRATEKGAEILRSAKVTGLRRIEGRIEGVECTGSLQDRVLKSQVVVNAEGFRGNIARKAGLPTVSRRGLLPAYQYEVKGVDMDENTVEMYYCNRVAPGFFAWTIPLGDNRARVGLAARNYTKQRLNAAMRFHGPLSSRLKRARRTRGMGGVVLVTLPVEKTYAKGIVTVGDAGGFVKATTGGGVIIGGHIAKIAGKTISHALTMDSDVDSFLEYYQKAWKGKFLRELWSMYIVQRFLTSLTNRGLDSLIKDVDEWGLVSVIRKEGDMDRQWRVIRRLLTDPRTYLTGLRAIRHFNPLL